MIDIISWHFSGVFLFIVIFKARFKTLSRTRERILTLQVQSHNE